MRHFRLMTSSDICLRFDKNIASKVREVYNNSMGRRLLWKHQQNKRHFSITVQTL